MNVLILEDEKNAAIRLEELLADVAPEAEVIGILETVSETLQWFKNGKKKPDIILSDIQLADGLSIDAFAQLDIKVPVVFTTAYDAYTLKAFKLNSIDYLLKPIDKAELKAAFNKYRALHGVENNNIDPKLLSVIQHIVTGKASYRSRFLLRRGERLFTVPAEEIAFIRADDKIVFLLTKNKQKHIIDESLEELEKTLDPALFFRINRTYIVQLSTIDKISNHFNGRLKISLHNWDDDDIFVSKPRAADFKKWLNK
jgi:DNA-binding LytR/AlgR family response regulator